MAKMSQNPTSMNRLLKKFDKKKTSYVKCFTDDADIKKSKFKSNFKQILKSARLYIWYFRAQCFYCFRIVSACISQFNS